MIKAATSRPIQRIFVFGVVEHKPLESRQGLERFPERTTYRVLRPELRGYWEFFGRIDVGEGFFFHAPVPADTDPASFEVVSQASVTLVRPDGVVSPHWKELISHA